MDENNNEIKRELVHSCYVVSNHDKTQDAIIIKEIIHQGDKQKRNMRIINNPIRPYWILKKDYRTYTQKKECEDLAKLDVYYTNQAKLATEIDKHFRGFASNQYVNLRKACQSPYVYGTDIEPTVLIAKEYRDKEPTLMTDSTLALMDYETDVVHGTNDIISGVLLVDDVLHIAVTKDFLGPLVDIAEFEFNKCAEQYIGDLLQERNIKVKFDIVDRSSSAVIKLVGTAHKHQPDFLCFWNMAFDVEKMIDCLTKDGYDLAQVFSDPSIPNEFKYFNWYKDPPFKTKANGQRLTKHVSELWHTVTAPASFYFICMMALYREVRDREQKRSSYSLDSVLTDHIGRGKLYMDHVPKDIEGLAWHVEMQKYHKIEYLVYMAFDALGPVLFDEKTHDVSRSLRAIIGTSDFSQMKRNPKRLSDDLHFSLLSQGKVLASTSNDMTEEFDSFTPSTNSWVITLASELESNIGRCLIKEYPNLETNITTHAFDIDVRSAYPETEVALNVGKSTRMYELCQVDGLSFHSGRSIGINLTSVKTNALDMAQLLYGFKSLDYYLDEFKKEIIE